MMIAELRWTESLAVGVDRIDEQHRELIERINNLRAAMSQGRSKEEIRETIGFLEAYVVVHFAAEEQAMLASAYPYEALHKAEHTAFIRDFAVIKEKLERLEREGMITSFAAIETQRKLSDWLVNHIGKSDKVLGAYLNSRGQESPASNHAGGYI